MSENDEFARKLAEEQMRANQEAFNDVTQGIEAGFRLASQETAQQAAARHNQSQREQKQSQDEEAKSALAKAQEYENENLRKAREAGQNIVGNQEEQPYGYGTTVSPTSTTNNVSDNVEIPSYQGATINATEATTLGSQDTAQTTTYGMDGNESVSNTSTLSATPLSSEQTVFEANEMPQTMSLSPVTNESLMNVQALNGEQPGQRIQQPNDNMNDPFAAWRAENQMRAATFDMNQSEQRMYDENLNPQTTDSYSVGSTEQTMMGSFTQDLSDDNRVLYKTIRTANTDETGPIQTGSQPATQTGNTQKGTPPLNAKDTDQDNKIYVNDQTFASRFDDTIFWKSEERKKAWEQFVNGFKNAKTVEDFIENGLWASLEIGLDMINAYFDWEASEGKKLGAFIKESKKTYDAEQYKASGISPAEGYKRTHDAVHAAKDFWTAFEKQEFYGNLPKNEWGGIDLKNCTNEQKAMMGEFQVRYAQSSPEFKKSMESMLGREFNGEDIMIAAEGIRNTLHGYERNPGARPAEGNANDTFDNNPTPRSPTPPSPTPAAPIKPASETVMPKDVTPMRPDNRIEPVLTPDRTLENHTPKALENNENTSIIQRMEPIKDVKENVVIDGKTGEVLDGVEVPDKEFMRDVTPPKGPLKNVRPTEFGDLNRQATENIRLMHDTAEAMRNNTDNWNIIEASRNGGRPTPGGRPTNRTLGLNSGHEAA